MSRSKTAVLAICVGVCTVGISPVRAGRSAGDTAVSRSPSAARSVVALVPAGRMGDLHLVDAYVYGASDLRSYQIAIETDGGRRGKLDLTAVMIDQQRGDYVFHGSSVVTAESASLSHVAAVSYDSGRRVSDWAYLGTYVLRPTSDATGEFRVRVRTADGGSLLGDSGNQSLAFHAGPDVTIRLADRPTKRAAQKAETR